jgi:hypothetical protein
MLSAACTVHRREILKDWNSKSEMLFKMLGGTFFIWEGGFKIDFKDNEFNFIIIFINNIFY